MESILIAGALFIAIIMLAVVCCGFCQQAHTTTQGKRTGDDRAWNGHWSTNTDGGIGGMGTSSTTDSSWGYDTSGGGCDSGGGFCDSSGGGCDSGGGGGGDSGGGSCSTD